MSNKLIESLLLSELEEVKGGKSSNDCICQSGAMQVVLPTDPDEPNDPDEPVSC